MEKLTNLPQQLAKIQQEIAGLQQSLRTTTTPSSETLNRLLDEIQGETESFSEAWMSLETDRQHYYDLFELAPDGQLVTDVNGSVLKANQAAVRMLNLDNRFLLHKPLLEFIPPAHRVEFRLQLARIQRLHIDHAFEIELIPRNTDKPMSLLVTSSILHDITTSQPLIHWSLRDISERKHLEEALNTLNTELEHRVDQRTEKLEQAYRQQEGLLNREALARSEAERANSLRLQFLAMISHELRTPLTSIKGFASTLLAHDVDWDADRWLAFVTIIDEESDKLIELVEQLLDLSRLQAGTLSISATPTLLSEILKVVQPQLEMLTFEHQLVLDVPEKLPLALADKRRISQVISNLVSNAVKYSPRQTEITLRAQYVDSSLQVSVSDCGSGIPRNEWDTVFTPFYQLSSSGIKRTGAGLGLAICKALVERHGGRIWIQERSEPGTAVTFTLPLAL